jgi:YVTN family beta-propeller protein
VPVCARREVKMKAIVRHAALVLAAAFVLGGDPALAAILFVSNEKDNTVTVLDSETLKIIKTIPVGQRPRGIVISPDFRKRCLDPTFRWRPACGRHERSLRPRMKAGRAMPSSR